MSIAHANDLPRYTYKDYRLWEGDWELIDGIPYAMTPSPKIAHQSIASKITQLLGNSIEECDACMVLMEQDWKINEFTTVRPDVVLACNETSEDYLTRRPEIIFEVISKSSMQRDEELKFRLYASEQVPFYAIIYPNDRKARLFRLEGVHYRKVDDFTTETMEFDGLPCKASIDFRQVFKHLKHSA